MFSIFKKRELSFIESRQETEDVYSFLFEREKDLTWKAGQYGLFSITHKSIKTLQNHSAWQLLLQRI